MGAAGWLAAQSYKASQRQWTRLSHLLHVMGKQARLSSCLTVRIQGERKSIESSLPSLARPGQGQVVEKEPGVGGRGRVLMPDAVPAGWTLTEASLLRSGLPLSCLVNSPISRLRVGLVGMQGSTASTTTNSCKNLSKLLSL